MANTLENTLNKVGDAIESLFGSNKSSNGKASKNGKSMSQLEKVGTEMRREHLLRNEWLKDLQYTKTLVDAEYNIQTEFKVR